MSLRSPDLDIGNVRLPGGLVDAVETGELVIFAGAGVSRNEPANYPHFEGLTTELSKDAVVERRQGEKPDAYLGRIEAKRGLIGNLARRYFQENPAEATRAHKALVRLRARDHNVRIVTTNYDELFEKADPDLPAWSAPALPRGDDFSGIVHLHGRAKDGASRMVITDRDFGEAYLSEAWARDFILDLYRTHPVLFVGYSHDDLVMTYLARGLGVGPNPKYVLIANDEPGDKWDALGITRVPYPKRDNSYEVLLDTLEAWADFHQKPEIDHERMIQAITARSPDDASALEESIVRRALMSPGRANYFLRHARGSNWLHWAKRRGLLDPLMGKAPASDAYITTMANWVTQEALGDEPATVRALLTEIGGEMSDVLKSRIAYTVINSRDLTADALRLWGPVLLQQPTNSQYLQELMQAARKVNVAEVALAALDALLTPQLVLRSDYFARWFAHFAGEEEEQPQAADRPEVITPADSWNIIAGYCEETAHWLLQQQAAPLVSRLCELAASHLARGHDLLRSAGAQWDHGDDPWSHDAAELGPLEANPATADNGRAVLLRLTISGYDALKQVAPQRADQYLQRLTASGYPILVRIALYLEVKQNDPDRIISFIADHPELFRWAAAVEEARDAVTTYYRQSIQDERERLNAVLEHLVDEGMTFAHAAARSVGLQVRDLDFSDYFREQEQRQTRAQTPTPADLLGSKLEELVSELEAGLIKEGEGPPAELRRAISDAAATSPDWALDVARCIAEADRWESPLWPPIIHGAAMAPTGNDHSRHLLVELAAWDVEAAKNEQVKLVDWVMQSGALQEESRAAAVSLLTSIGPTEVNAENWIEALLQTTESIRVVDADFQLGELYDRLKATMATSGSVRQAVGKNLWRLNQANREWVEHEVLPLLSSKELGHQESIDDLIEGVLHGDTRWPEGELARAVIMVIPARLESLAGRAPQPTVVTPEGKCDKLIDSLSAEEQKAVGLAVRVAIDATADPYHVWLGAFIVNAREGVRIAWTRQIGGQIRQSDHLASRVWSNWGRQYLERRVSGLPVPLSGCEVRELFDWVAALPADDFEDAVPLLEMAPPPTSSKYDFARRLVDQGLPDARPEATSRLLMMALQSVALVQTWRDHVRIAAEAVGKHQPDSWDRLTDALLTSGLASADEVEDWADAAEPEDRPSTPT